MYVSRRKHQVILRLCFYEPCNEDTAESPKILITSSLYHGLISSDRASSRETTLDWEESMCLKKRYIKIDVDHPQDSQKERQENKPSAPIPPKTEQKIRPHIQLDITDRRLASRCRSAAYSPPSSSREQHSPPGSRGTSRRRRPPPRPRLVPRTPRIKTADIPAAAYVCYRVSCLPACLPACLLKDFCYVDRDQTASSPEIYG
ncbi:hypothetical protein F4778DRAFT_254939 [Xylariomycetidae sp. FL2044]|nr:hypothetical protein F4778DRAFT_254939 [Xylariomycetidae sp. FL2044]